MKEYKCKCITCRHIAEMRNLIPNKDLCNKVMKVTDDLYDAMASEIIDKDMEIIKLKAKLVQCHNKNTELKGDIARGNSKLQDEIEKLEGYCDQYSEQLNKLKNK